MPKLSLFLLLSLLAGMIHAQGESLLKAEQLDMQPKRVLYDKRQPDGRYQLALGAIERIDGLWQPESSRILQGQLRRRTLEFDAGQSLSGLFEHYQSLATQAGAQSLFSCTGRDCGRSNNWANGFFHIPQLYGREDSQRLSTFWLQQGDQQQYLTLYIVRRGNQRIYLQQDLVQFSGRPSDTRVPSAQELQETLSAKGLLRLNQSNGALVQDAGELQLQGSWLEVLVQLVEREPKPIKAVVHVVLRDRKASLAAANALQAKLSSALAARGISAEGISFEALGNIAPLATRPEQARIDLMFD